MILSGKKILVTGSTGFIGSHLCEELVKKGAKLHALLHYNSGGREGNLGELPSSIRQNIEVSFGDICDYHLVESLVKGKDLVFHLAALIGIPYSYVAPLSYINTNIIGTHNILEACRKHGIEKIIHTSTSETYGTAIYAPIDEKHPLQGQSPYSASKIAADKLAESYYLSFNVPVATLRPFNTFGPRQSMRAIIPTIIMQAFKNDAIKLGLVSPVRDLNYVKNTVEGFTRIAESDLTIGHTINVGTGLGITIGDLAEKILKLMNIKKPIIEERERIRPENSEVHKLICNYSEAERLMGWKPHYSLDEGLIETIDFFNRRKEFFNDLDKYFI